MPSEMKILGTVEYEVIEVGDKYYHRSGPDDWMELFGSTLEPVYSGLERLEKMYQCLASAED